MPNLEKAKTIGIEALWRFFGALFMETKTLPDGTPTRAASLHRLLALVCFGVCMVLWLMPGVEPPSPEVVEALAAAGIDLEQVMVTGQRVPESLMWTLWGLLGLNGGNKIASTLAAIRGQTAIATLSSESQK